MIIDFQKITHDYYGNVEQPVLLLKTRDGRPVTVISNYINLQTTFRFNDVSEISFEVPRYFDGEENPCYSEIFGMRRVQLDDLGDFVIVNPTVENEGGNKETMTCKCYSLEYEFNYKKISLASGTYNFHNLIHNEDTILTMIQEIMPDWSIGSISKDLIGRWRTFDQVDENLYSFMMNTLQDSYGCLFLFDVTNKVINVISTSDTPKDLPIYLSYNNLVQSVKIEELSDDIVTALSGYGSGDEVNIRSVNPNGTNTIYNLDYFIAKGDLPEDLAEKWNSYMETYDLQQQVYSNFMVAYENKSTEKLCADSKLAALQVEAKALDAVILAAKVDGSVDEDGDPTNLPETGAYDTLEEYRNYIDDLQAQLDVKNEEIAEQEALIASIDSSYDELAADISAIIESCKISSYFTEEEQRILTQYFKEDSIQEDTFVIPEYGAATNESQADLIGGDGGTLKIIGSNKYATNVVEVFAKDEDGEYVVSQDIAEGTIAKDEDGNDMYDDDGNPIYENSTDTLNSNIDLDAANLSDEMAQKVVDQLNEATKRKMYEFRGGKLELEYKKESIVEGETVYEDVVISGDIISADFSYNTENLVDDPTSEINAANGFLAAITLNNGYYNGVEYATMNISMQGYIDESQVITGDDFLNAVIKDGISYSTSSSTTNQKQAVLQELYEYVDDALKKLAYPSCEFSVESSNFVFAQEFEPFKDELELGCSVTLALDDEEEVILKPLLIELELNWDNATDFKITFSDKYNSADSTFELADLITDMSHTTASVSLNKANYTQYANSQAGNQISSLTNDALDVAKNNIVNSINQSIEMNSSGAFFRKKTDSGFSDEQLALINNTIAMTKDGWNSVEVAIGKIFDENATTTDSDGNETHYGYGIAAPKLFGTILAGNNLVIQNTVLGDDGTTVVKEFTVDGSGAWLNNASFIIANDGDATHAGGKILIDPRWGIAAGNSELYTNEGSDINPAFIDDEGNVVYDESQTIVIKKEDGTYERRYYVPKNTTFWLDAATGDSYFGGTINASNIIAGTFNGNVVASGTLGGDALTDGTVDSGSKLSGSVNADQLYENVVAAINQYAMGEDIKKINTAVIGDLTAENFYGNTIVANSISADYTFSNELKTQIANIASATIGEIDTSRLIIQKEDAGKLFIVPEYGFAAGNKDLFTIGEDGSLAPSFIDTDGSLIVGDDGTPINTAFYFDINTGTGYFGGSINGSQITANSIDATQLKADGAYITNAMIGNLDAGKITTGTLDADLISAQSITSDKLNVDTAYVATVLADAGLITTATITDGHVTGYLDSVSINANNITAGTLTADRLLLNGEDGLLYEINNLGELISTSTDTLDGAVITPRTITADHIVAETITSNELHSDSVTSSKILAGAITTEKLDASAVTADKIAANAITADKIDAGAITADKIAADAVTADKISVTDLYALDAKIGGFIIDESSIYSTGKSGINNTTRGLYFDNTGQVNVGDSNSYVKVYKDSNDKMQVEICAAKLTFTSNPSASVETVITEASSNASAAKTAAESAESIASSANTAAADALAKANKSVTGTVYYYAQTLSPSTPPENEAYSTTAPTDFSSTYVWQKVINIYADGTRDGLSEVEGVCITGHPGESAASLTILSTEGNIFKNSNISTKLYVNVICGSLLIEDYEALQDLFGESVALQWQEKNSTGDYEDIAADDSRISDDGFILTITTSDVIDKSIYKCTLVY